MKKYLSEFLGTFFLVFAGCGAIIINQQTGGSIGHVGIALTFGLVVLVMIYSVGEVSGAHFNPAVTLGFCAAQRMSLKEGAPYIVSQCLGALLASLLLRILFPSSTQGGATLPVGGLVPAFVLEFFNDIPFQCHDIILNRIIPFADQFYYCIFLCVVSN